MSHFPLIVVTKSEIATPDELVPLIDNLVEPYKEVLINNKYKNFIDKTDELKRAFEKFTFKEFMSLLSVYNEENSEGKYGRYERKKPIELDKYVFGGQYNCIFKLLLDDDTSFHLPGIHENYIVSALVKNLDIDNLDEENLDDLQLLFEYQYWKERPDDLKKFLKDLKPNTRLTILDCHI